MSTISIEPFSNDGRILNPKEITPAETTTAANSATNQSEFLGINLLKAQVKSRMQGAIDSSFASHWVKNWRESLQPVTKRRNRTHTVALEDCFILSYFVWQGQPLARTKIEVSRLRPIQPE